MKKINKILIGILAIILLSFVCFVIDKKYHNSIIGSRTDSGITIWGDIIGDIAEQTDLAAYIASSSPSVDLSGYLSTTTAASTYYRQTNPSGYISSTSSETLTNKRITPRVGSLTASTSLTIDTDLYDQFYLTEMTATSSITTSGTPTSGQKLILGIVSSSTAQGLTFGTTFATSSDLDLPSTTVANKTMYLGFIWNTVKSKWVLMALLNNI